MNELNYKKMNTFQMLNQTFMNLNMNNVNNQINYNKFSLLSLINPSILVPSHPHPLIYCLTIERYKHVKICYCNKCNNTIHINIPSFYCVFCDFDICEGCILSHHLSEITIFNYNMNLFNLTMNIENQQLNWQLKFPSHNHLLTLIKKVNNSFIWFCNICNNKYENDSPFYYCSLCNFHLCQNCAIQQNNNKINRETNLKIDNTNDFSGSQMNNNNTSKSETNLRFENPEYLTGSQMNNNNNIAKNEAKLKLDNPNYLTGNQMNNNNTGSIWSNLEINAQNYFAGHQINNNNTSSSGSNLKVDAPNFFDGHQINNNNTSSSGSNLKIDAPNYLSGNQLK